MDDAAFRRVFSHAMREALGDEGLGVSFVEAGSLAEARSRLREGGLEAWPKTQAPSVATELRTHGEP